MKTFSKKYLVLASVAAGALISTATMAAVPSDVKNTKHNFSMTGGSNVLKAASGSGVTQVCVFCHTPHNAGQTKLLWNKASNASAAFRLYTSSGTLTTVTKASSLPAGSPSLLCLGCHDGKTAMNILHASSAGIDAATAGVTGYGTGTKLIPWRNIFVDNQTTGLVMPDPEWDFFTMSYAPAMNIGGSATGTDLTNDHPIGFSYSDVLSESAVGLQSVAYAEGRSIKFFGASKIVECSSCHDPHVDTSGDLTYKPFLVASNTGSALCLSCHDK